ncbi:helix-turn-helix domain-containing protein [Foetidibacter luteolus]|uniref:helix-turn-helix domain-containing protein n=1 Tax=Foetidibacter luteolus TaxID=2608880 RepID=UPI001A98C2DC|nr:helix-turn-helix transcriptional regulator [Foetidibacter luteolus]
MENIISERTKMQATQMSVLPGTFQQRVLSVCVQQFGSQQRFFRLTGFSERQWYRIVRANSNPTLHSIIMLARALNVHPKELFDYDGTANEPLNF